MAPPAPGPLDAPLDRLRFEVQYLVDVLHLARGQGQCMISAVSLRKSVDGLLDVADQVQRVAASLVPAPVQPPAPAGG